MATINVTNRFLNDQKRYAESIVVSQPSLLSSGGQRLSTPPVYAQYTDAHVSSVIEPDTIMKKAYLVIDEAFPAATTVTVTAGATTIFSAVVGTVAGITVSATEDLLFTAGADITVTLGGATGDVVSGSARVVLDTDSLSLKNGNYAASIV